VAIEQGLFEGLINQLNVFVGPYQTQLCNQLQNLYIPNPKRIIKRRRHFALTIRRKLRARNESIVRLEWIHHPLLRLQIPDLPEPETTNLLSKETSAALICSSSGNSSPTCFPVSTSQIRTVWSRELETMCLESFGGNATERTLFVCLPHQMSCLLGGRSIPYLCSRWKPR